MTNNDAIELRRKKHNINTHGHIHTHIRQIYEIQLHKLCDSCFVLRRALCYSICSLFSSSSLFSVFYYVESQTITIIFFSIHIYFRRVGTKLKLDKISLFHVITNVWTHSIVYFVCVAKRIERILSEHFYCLYGTEKKHQQLLRNMCKCCVWATSFVFSIQPFILTQCIIYIEALCCRYGCCFCCCYCCRRFPCCFHSLLSLSFILISSKPSTNFLTKNFVCYSIVSDMYLL